MKILVDFFCYLCVNLSVNLSKKTLEKDGPKWYNIQHWDKWKDYMSNYKKYENNVDKDERQRSWTPRNDGYHQRRSCHGGQSCGHSCGQSQTQPQQKPKLSIPVEVILRMTAYLFIIASCMKYLKG